MAKGIIILSHGSRNSKSNHEFKQVVRSVKRDTSIENIRAAVLEFAEPQLETVVNQMVNKEIGEIIILPLFLFAGYHVTKNIPDLVEDMKNKYPEVTFRTMKHIGADKSFIEMITAKMQQT